MGQVVTERSLVNLETVGRAKSTKLKPAPIQPPLTTKHAHWHTHHSLSLSEPGLAGSPIVQYLVCVQICFLEGGPLGQQEKKINLFIEDIISFPSVPVQYGDAMESTRVIRYIKLFYLLQPASVVSQAS